MTNSDGLTFADKEAHRHTDITEFLKISLGKDIPEKVIITEIKDVTYPIKPYIWDNWFPFAYIAFRKLAERIRESSQTIKSFATIGTGNDADAIGALYAFQNLENIILTDIDGRVIPISYDNVHKYAEKEVSKDLITQLTEDNLVHRSRKNIMVIALEGLLCEPLRKNGLKVDIIYENLPNIPDSSNIIEGYRRASRYQDGSMINQDRMDNFDEKLVEAHKIMKAYLLESHFAALIEAKDSLNPSGSVICSVGGRVPYEVLIKMVLSSGYDHEELVAGFKRQTEPEEVLTGYVEAEKNGIEFDFYRYDDALGHLKDLRIQEPFCELNGVSLKNLLEPHRISAKEAFRLYKENPNFSIGHTLHMIRAIRPRCANTEIYS